MDFLACFSSSLRLSFLLTQNVPEVRTLLVVVVVFVVSHTKYIRGKIEHQFAFRLVVVMLLYV